MLSYDYKVHSNYAISSAHKNVMVLLFCMQRLQASLFTCLLHTGREHVPPLEPVKPKLQVQSLISSLARAKHSLLDTRCTYLLLASFCTCLLHTRHKLRRYFLHSQRCRRKKSSWELPETSLIPVGNAGKQYLMWLRYLLNIWPSHRVYTKHIHLPPCTRPQYKGCIGVH